MTRSSFTRVHRIEVTFRTNYFLTTTHVEDIAGYLKAPPRALQNNLAQWDIFKKNELLHFHLFSRRRLASVHTQLRVGVVTLPRQLLEAGEIAEVYADLLTENAEAVLMGRPIKNPFRSILLDEAYTDMAALKAAMDRTPFPGDKTSQRLVIKCHRGLGVAYYESLYMPTH